MIAADGGGLLCHCVTSPHTVRSHPRQREPKYVTSQHRITMRGATPYTERTVEDACPYNVILSVSEESLIKNYEFRFFVALLLGMTIKTTDYR